MSKPYKLGFAVGRFQGFHMGHYEMIQKGIELCDKFIVLIGSSQEQCTIKNPFSYLERAEILRMVFEDKIEIYPIQDIAVGENNEWGKYLFDTVLIHSNEKEPELYITGTEIIRDDWFNGLDINFDMLAISKTQKINGTAMRNYLLNKDFESWKQYAPKALWDKFNWMGARVRRIYGKTEEK